MPRASNEKKAKAEKLFREGMKLIDIAKEINVPEGTIRSWKNRGKWENFSNNFCCNVAEKDNATLQKKKRGGQIGNKNAKGSKGGAAPLRNKNAETHGAYSKVYWDALDEEEISLIRNMDSVEEEQLIMQLQMFSVRERRLMRSIKKYKELEIKNRGLAVKAVSKTKKVEDIVDVDGESLNSGEYKRITETSVTRTEAVMNSIMLLEAELTKIQKAKTKAIEALARIRIENTRLESEEVGNIIVDDWIAAVMGDEENANE